LILKCITSLNFIQIDAENDVINESWDKEGKPQNLADSIGLMVYEGSQSLKYVKNYVDGANQFEGKNAH
jgi:hypothetical protein